MRILAVTNMYPTAAFPALGTFVEQQIKGLRDTGLDVDVLLFDRASGGPGVYRNGKTRTRQQLDSRHYDLVHSMYGGVLADIVTRAVRGRPVVVTIHGSDLFGETCSGFVRRSLAYLGVCATRQAVRRAEGVVVVSPHLQNALPRGVDRSRVRVIPCGIDLERFRPEDSTQCRQALGWHEDSFHVLFANNGNPIKRPELANEAVTRLRSLGVDAVLHELRGIAYDDVPRWINASDVLLLTSAHEGSPTIVKESLSCNLPVVSVDVGDVRSRIDGIAGCAIVSADSGDLAAALYNVRSAGRRRIEGRIRLSELSLARVATRLSDFYHEVIAGYAAPQEHRRVVRSGEAIQNGDPT